MLNFETLCCELLSGILEWLVALYSQWLDDDNRINFTKLEMSHGWHDSQTDISLLFLSSY